MISVQPPAVGPQCAAAAAWALSRNAASGARTQATSTDARLWLRTAHVLSKCANLNAFVVQCSLYRTTISGSISSGTDNCPMCQKVLAGKASMTATIKTIKVCQPELSWVSASHRDKAQDAFIYVSNRDRQGRILSY